MTTQPFHQVEHSVAEPNAADLPGQGKAPANRSLERGLDVLRAFRPGTEYLTNGDLSVHLGLPKSTVSRLTQTLVRTGFLDYDSGRSAYRPAPSFLGLAHAMHQGSSLLQAASPLMMKVAKEHQVNVSLAAADRDEMIYLESIRLSQRKTPRNVLAGQRLPMDITSLGRASLAGLGEAQREALIATLCARRCDARRVQLEQEIRAAIASVHSKGYCLAAWQPEVVAIATPLGLPGYRSHALNISLATPLSLAEIEERYSGVLMELAAAIREAHRASQA